MELEQRRNFQTSTHGGWTSWAPAGGSTTSYTTIYSTCHTLSYERLSIFWGSSSNECAMHQGLMKMRSIKNNLEHKKDRETNIFYLYADHEPLTFQEPVEEDCWRSTMEEEIHAIQKNDTWKLTMLS